MILDVSHFTQKVLPNFEDIEFIHCYDATRLFSVKEIEQGGLLLPTVERLSDKLIELGFESVDQVLLERIIHDNGKNIFAAMSKDHLLGNCIFHKEGSEKGPEKIRKYIEKIRATIEPSLLEKIERNRANLTGFVFDLCLPVHFFDEKDLFDCLFDEDQLLDDDVAEADLTLEICQDIPPKYCTVYEMIKCGESGKE